MTLVAGAGAYFFIDQFDLGSVAARLASRALGRSVSIGSLHVTPGRWMRFVLRQGRLDNPPGGTRPTMAEVVEVTSEVKATSLLHGPLIVRGLVVDDLQLFLEHAPGQSPNWRFGPASPSSTEPPGRTWFPTLLDARGTGAVLDRTRSGAEEQIRFDRLSMRTEAADRPVRLTADGAYNGVPLQLAAVLAPFTVLRQAAVAYPVDLRLTSGETVLTFRGTTGHPFTIDDSHGTLALTAPTPEALYRIMKIDSGVAPAIRLTGTVGHAGTVWQLTEARGAVNAAVIEQGAITLTEGDGKPDRVAVDLVFGQLDLNTVLRSKGGSASNGDMPLAVETGPDPEVDVKLSAHNLAYAGVEAVEATVRPGKIAVEALSMGYLGAKIRATGEITEVDRGHSAGERSGGGTVSAEVEVADLDIQALRRLLGIGSLPLAGRVEGQLSVKGTGATLNEAAREARISTVATMTGGSIARKIIELASTDARTLFRIARGMTPIACAVAVLDVRAGIGTISPLRIETADGTIVAKGRFDLYRGTLDLTVNSESRTTSVFALDVPLRVNGTLSNPRIGPAELSSAGRAGVASGDDVSRLVPSLQPFARRSRCLFEGKRSTP
jgi:uncharacterized protein involved in outer membrane biogenesis